MSSNLVYQMLFLFAQIDKSICMIYKIHTFQYEADKFLYGLGKGHQL